ncbi:Ribosome-binding factor A [compost metagenome]|jgi:ribosome-binding factor A
MGSQRAGRVGEVIKEVASETIRRLKDPRITGLVSVTDVEVSGDMSHAKVFVSIYGDEDQQRETLEGLQAASGYVRTQVGREVKLRVTPEIHFRQDKSLEQGANINALLLQIKREKEQSEHGE